VPAMEYAHARRWWVIRLWQHSWLDLSRHRHMFERCPSSNQLSWRGRIPDLAGESIFYGRTVKRKSSKALLRNMTPSSGLLSTLRRGGKQIATTVLRINH
jgi:hypothetical protein